MGMINRAQSLKIAADTDVSTDTTSDNKFMLSVQTYGSENTDLTRETMLAYMYYNMGQKPFPMVPKPYTPAVAEKQGKQHPPFNADDIPFFHESGKKLAESNDEKIAESNDAKK